MRLFDIYAEQCLKRRRDEYDESVTVEDERWVRQILEDGREFPTGSLELFNPVTQVTALRGEVFKLLADVDEYLAWRERPFR